MKPAVGENLDANIDKALALKSAQQMVPLEDLMEKYAVKEAAEREAEQKSRPVDVPGAGSAGDC